VGVDGAALYVDFGLIPVVGVPSRIAPTGIGDSSGKSQAKGRVVDPTNRRGRDDVAELVQ
jgi:hypothetical protein